MIITVSASYGAGGSVVAPAVAEALGVPFLDRAVPGRDLADAGCEAATAEERTGGLWSRVLDAFARMPTETAPAAALGVLGSEDSLRERAERRLREFVAGGEGVVLGWAAAVVVEGAYKVRLHGPAAARLRQGMAIEGRGEAETRRRLEDTDRVRALYWKRLYRIDWDDPSLHHLAVDSTALPLPVVTELIVQAARSYGRPSPR